eukprot:1203076-Ditylum_brightwellii.AAC.1
MEVVDGNEGIQIAVTVAQAEATMRTNWILSQARYHSRSLRASLCLMLPPRTRACHSWQMM